jgi:DNA-binding transcriptional LysR family regulator
MEAAPTRHYPQRRVEEPAMLQPSSTRTGKNQMSRSSLNYHQVELLYHVVRARTLTAAAESLHISQPAVTKQVRALEESLGMQLFHRRGGRLVPTVEAILLSEQVERTQSSLRALNELAHRLRIGALGHLSICAIPAVTERLLPNVIARFQQEFPHIFVEVTIENAERMLDLVESQQVDIGICAPFREMRHVEETPLLTSRIVCAVSAKDPLRKRKSIRLDELLGQPITVVGALESIPELKSGLGSSESGKQVHCRVSSSMLACKLVLLNHGRALVDTVTAVSLDSKGMVFLALPEIPERKIAVLKPSLRPAGRFADEFGKMLAEEQPPSGCVDLPGFLRPTISIETGLFEVRRFSGRWEKPPEETIGRRVFSCRANDKQTHRGARPLRY